MTDLHHQNPCRLPTLLLFTLLSMIGISVLWEFKFEALAMQWLNLPYDSDFEDAERWRFVLTATAFSLLSLIAPTLVLKRLVANTRSSYRRLQRVQLLTEALAKYDSLTGLINRRIFMESLLDQLGRNHPAAIMLIDLDHFKAINDQHGHSVGDHTLIEVGRRLQDIARLYDGMAVRLGGDEFCLLFLTHKEENELVEIAETVLSKLAKPLPETKGFCRLGATIGISRSWLDAQEASALLHCADIAMYKGKSNGRLTFSFYDSEYECQRRAQSELEVALRQALEGEEIVPFYQPIVILPAQEIVGFEILARWVKPDGSIGMPADFIPVLERLGLISAMTRSLVKQACRAAKSWDGHLHLSLNISAAMVADQFFPDQLLEQLTHEKFPFNRFEIEITEEALVGNLEAAQRNLSRLNSHGITVALDDFGTGYSGLYHLTRLSIDKIKIDRSFFEAGQTDHLPMVEAILGMARSMNMKVTAEGIEDFHLPHLPSWLADNGCHYAQGYLYGRPQAHVEMVPVLAEFPFN
ncbi:bifunctional diguanylate cyclase/phosphodiesterase [Pseudomonas sp. LP_7_YM]|uniref:putative bifunctional diguanylate cyclase/phosphodiesterase n=1 Tax=Pseudomonas sp. LP_7_YM TaxID=2485137 RepID=UPI00105C20BB|nr:bifunctional diguanylate cyclase/phosphodiesterase [Pseudomonas sp. LP_7_YM]TDV67682.1 diguanylate cyclase/phosphodiesterase [Pseudomonas sp. LP_7_YM]